jgi:Protein of unknown function (DUF541)
MSARLRLAVQPSRRSGSILLVAALTIAVAACSSAAPPSSTVNQGVPNTSVPVVAASSSSQSIGDVGAPVPIGATTAVGANASGTSAGGSGSAIAYPYPIFGGTPGVAPDHSILVTGAGQSPMKADGSNAAAAERTALAAALDEAKQRADEVAAATGVTIHGVLSVSVSVGQGWIAPIGIESPGGTTIPPTVGSAPAPVPTTPGPVEMGVTVTVAYQIAS